jgi:hypothetical protein
METPTYYISDFLGGYSFYRLDGEELVKLCWISNQILDSTARLYELVLPREEYQGYSHAVCTDLNDIYLFKELPLTLLPPVYPSCTLLTCDFAQLTCDPKEADEFWKLNNSSIYSEQRIFDGLSALEQAMNALERTETILSGSYTSNTSTPPHYISLKPKPHIVKTMIAESIASNSTCPITLNPITNETSVCVAPCYHVFEQKGIEQWLTQSPLCPTCREPCCL